MELNLEEHSPQQAVLHVTGRIDVQSADALKQEIRAAAERGLRQLVVDLDGVQVIDSSGLSALVSGYKAMHEQGGQLVLAGLGEQIKAALELTRLNRVFSIYDNNAAALASAASSGNQS